MTYPPVLGAGSRERLLGLVHDFDSVEFSLSHRIPGIVSTSAKARVPASRIFDFSVDSAFPARMICHVVPPRGWLGNIRGSFQRRFEETQSQADPMENNRWQGAIPKTLCLRSKRHPRGRQRIREFKDSRTVRISRQIKYSRPL
jgi:hypothetical protein